ncbi:GntR family transcriptional regulator [Celerinatantimonas sp. MCCC 1A17872]|uniref:GntR family transcriptional regulator n=1 Tax=Celerinatantimonas sp. MCCC 1A17872 TaxID=3177514 RepID=UPI0038C7C81D
MKGKLGQQSLSQRVYQQIRELITEGKLLPQQRLSEANLSEQLEVSRNTLREGFRLLTQEGLIVYQPHRGVCVACPQVQDIIDIYRVRRLIEIDAIKQSYPFHPALQTMRKAIQNAQQWRNEGDWQGVGTANMEFHRALVSLSDSERLQHLYYNIAAELRLAFNYLGSPERLHAPYIEKNDQLLVLLSAGKVTQAVTLLHDYLVASERLLLTAYSRHN